jgi:hypothetical protein
LGLVEQVKRVIICGSRGWTNRELIAEFLRDLKAEGGCLIVVGYNPEHRTPRGADEIAWEEAQKIGLPVETHPASWFQLGKRAGFIRNEEMAALGAALCMAFWDGASNGTRDMMARAKRYGIPTSVVSP